MNMMHRPKHRAIRLAEGIRWAVVKTIVGTLGAGAVLLVYAIYSMPRFF